MGADPNSPEDLAAVRQALGARIKEFRDRQGLTQLQLAERIGVAPQTVSQIERGKEGTSMANLVRISTVLDVPLSELFEFDDAPARDKEKRRAVQALVRLVQHEDVTLIKQVTRHARLLIQFARGSGNGAGGG